MIFETHAHYDDESFQKDREELLSSLPEKGIGRVVNVSSTLASVIESRKLAERFDFVSVAVGIHPTETAELNEERFSWLEEQAKGAKVVAIGEIGLDYYWEKEEEQQRRQRIWFVRQLALAKELRLPVVIHSRDAAADTVRLLKETDTGNASGVIHCYSYSPELAKEFIKMGYYIGIGGVVTFKNAKKLKETVRQIPPERMLLETDCPYMAPEPYRGIRNDSSYLPFVVKELAELTGMTEEEIERVTWENAMRLFFGEN